MGLIHLQDVAKELGFVQIEQVAGLLSIAHIFGSSKKRCGLYLLQLEDGNFYIGQAVDVVGRFAQHLKSKGRIQGFAFLPMAQRHLDNLEKRLIRAAEAAGIPLVNITHMSVIVGERDLDHLVSYQEQESWLSGAPNSQAIGERVVLSEALRHRFRHRFQQFSASPHFSELLEWLSLYIREVIIDPQRTEYTFWSVSCLPSAGSQAIWRRSYALSAAVMELFVVGRWRDGEPPAWAFMNVASDVLESAFGSVTKVMQRYPELELMDARYRDAGTHQVRLFAENGSCIPYLLADPAIKLAARSLALRVMRKRATIYGKYHCPQLANAAFEAVHL